MRCSFDPVGTASDDDAFFVGHARRQLVGDVLTVGGRGAGAGDRDSVTQRCREE